MNSDQPQTQPDDRGEGDPGQHSNRPGKSCPGALETRHIARIGGNQLNPGGSDGPHPLGVPFSEMTDMRGPRLEGGAADLSMHAGGSSFAPSVDESGLSRPELDLVRIWCRDRLTVFFVGSGQ